MAAAAVSFFPFYKPETTREENNDDSGENVVSGARRKAAEGETETDTRDTLSPEFKSWLVGQITTAIMHAIATAKWHGKPKTEHDLVPFLVLGLCGYEFDETTDEALGKLSGIRVNTRNGEWLSGARNIVNHHLIGQESLDLTELEKATSEALRALSIEASARTRNTTGKDRATIKREFYNREYRNNPSKQDDTLRRDLEKVGLQVVPKIKSDATNAGQLEKRIRDILTAQSEFFTDITNILEPEQPTKTPLRKAGEFINLLEAAPVQNLEQTIAALELRQKNNLSNASEVLKKETVSKILSDLLYALNEEGENALLKKDGKITSARIRRILDDMKTSPTISLHKGSTEGKFLDICKRWLRVHNNDDLPAHNEIIDVEISDNGPMNTSSASMVPATTKLRNKPSAIGESNATESFIVPTETNKNDDSTLLDHVVRIIPAQGNRAGNPQLKAVAPFPNDDATETRGALKTPNRSKHPTGRVASFSGNGSPDYTGVSLNETNHLKRKPTYGDKGYPSPPASAKVLSAASPAYDKKRYTGIGFDRDASPTRQTNNHTATSPSRSMLNASSNASSYSTPTSAKNDRSNNSTGKHVSFSDTSRNFFGTPISTIKGTPGSNSHLNISDRSGSYLYDDESDSSDDDLNTTIRVRKVTRKEQFTRNSKGEFESTENFTILETDRGERLKLDGAVDLSDLGLKIDGDNTSEEIRHSQSVGTPHKNVAAARVDQLNTRKRQRGKK